MKTIVMITGIPRSGKTFACKKIKDRWNGCVRIEHIDLADIVYFKKQVEESGIYDYIEQFLKNVDVCLVETHPMVLLKDDCWGNDVNFFSFSLLCKIQHHKAKK